MHDMVAIGVMKNFPTTSGILRTGATFASREDIGQHHKADPIQLDLIGLDMVRQMPPDVMHLIDFIVTEDEQRLRELLSTIIRKTELKSYIECHHANYKEYAPSIFARRPRSLAFFDKFKANV